jgi:hypothetical protein
MRAMNRVAAAVCVAAIATLSGGAVASATTAARTGLYSGIATETTESFALSQALYYAQSNGYAAGFKIGQCPEGSQNVAPYGPNYMATVYVSCYQS